MIVLERGMTFFLKKWSIVIIIYSVLVSSVQQSDSFTYVLSRSVMSNLLRPQRLQPARPLCPWDSPGKNSGVGCHFLLQGIFPGQRCNLRLACLLHWQVGSLLAESSVKPHSHTHTHTHTHTHALFQIPFRYRLLQDIIKFPVLFSRSLFSCYLLLYI